jgi:uncharacterized membrane protein
MIKALAAALLAASPALAELAVTAPIGTTTCVGGQVCAVTWDDNRSGVSLAQQGNCTIALYIGNAQQQTFLQPIAYPNSINVSQVASVQFTVDPTVGANNNEYFIRFSSTTLTNPTSPTNPYLSFSAKFTLSGMTGTFNSTVQQQLAGISSSGGVFTSAPTGSSSGTRAPTTTGTSSRAANTTTNAAFHGAGAASSVFVAGAAFVAGAVALF